MARVEFDTLLSGQRLAFMSDGGGNLTATGFFYLTGFMSDMSGSKAESLAEAAHASRRSLLRFDYSGHGQSGGAFTDGTISLWLEQAAHMFLTRAPGRRVIVGSSMGGWLALLLARKLKREDKAAFRRIAGLVLVCPATDMTRELIWQGMTPDQRRALIDRGRWDLPSDYGEPYPIMRNLIADGESHLMLHEPLAVPFPVRIVQGTDDRDVPVAHAERTLAILQGDDVTMTLVKGGDHRLSKLTQLRIVTDIAMRVAERADGEM
jgi:pimeloyl-ACP methyl ester carboxylesterase